MDSVKVLALAKAVKDAAIKTARKDVNVPKNAESVTHNVNLLARVSGTITVGADEEYIPTASVPLKASLALFIRYCGITRESAKAALVRAMTDALNENLDPKSKVEKIETAISEEDRLIADCEAQVSKMMGTLPKQTRNGKVTTDLTVKELVEV